MSTYLVAMRDANSKTLAEDHGPQPETDTEQAAKRRYRGHVRAFNEGRYADDRTILGYDLLPPRSSVLVHTRSAGEEAMP